MRRRSSLLSDQCYLDKGEGEPIVLLHGLFGNIHNWSSVVTHFSKNYRVIIPRLPLHEGAQHHDSLDSLCCVLHEFLELHQLADVTLAGHSAGGHLALLYALQQPHQVRRIVITGSTGLFENTSATEPAPVKKEKTAKALVDKVHLIRENRNATPLAAIYTSQRNELAASLHKINHPTLLIWGLQDTITIPETALHFHDLLPNAELKFIDDCGHLPMLEHPQLVNQHIETFLNHS